jgi:hypothetical protein
LGPNVDVGTTDVRAADRRLARRPTYATGCNAGGRMGAIADVGAADRGACTAAGDAAGHGVCDERVRA